MRIAKYFPYICLFILISGLVIPLLQNPGSVFARPDKLAWSVVKTPSYVDNLTVSPSEVNFIAVGSDDRTIYAVDVAKSQLYKSVDTGSTWNANLVKTLQSAGASMPVWNIAIAPDNPSFIVVVTSNNSSSNGKSPQKVFISTDGGGNWDNPPGLTILTTSENISTVDVSPSYGNNNRDIVVGTRSRSASGVVSGSVFILKTPSFAGGGWLKQTELPSTGWTAADVIKLKFSPNYASDYGLAVVVSTAADTFLNMGIRDLLANTTNWNLVYTTPGVEIKTPSAPVGVSPDAKNIVVADLQLPSDFQAQNVSLRRYYVSYEDNTSSSFAGVYRRDDNLAAFSQILSSTATGGHGISSIAYFGTYASGKLLAGEIKADPLTGISTVWITDKPVDASPAWAKAVKPPTGGANPVAPGEYRANAQLAWGKSGSRAYCGTSSADLYIPATATALSGWPDGYRQTVPRDESAFSISPYSISYERKINGLAEAGSTWNQIGLIDTEITRFSDTAILEVTENSPSGYNVLYVSSVNKSGDVRSCDSVWRSVSDVLGDRWERIYCIATGDDIILRVNSGNSYVTRYRQSSVLVFADRLTSNLKYSSDEGQSWQNVFTSAVVKDISLSSDTTMYILDEKSVWKGALNGGIWNWQPPVTTGLETTHTIYALPEEMQSSDPLKIKRWVIVGDEEQGEVALCDFARAVPRFEKISALPIPGSVHVFLHGLFLQNNLIFAAVADEDGSEGSIYRWTLGKSTGWQELSPPDKGFYGIALERDLLYGSWMRSVDRTLDGTFTLPPPLEWDILNYSVEASFADALFTREPSALKVTTDNKNNHLWIIDDSGYNWNGKFGCLWAYGDTFAIKGPVPISPPNNDDIPVDPKTGRSDQINFTWYQLEDAGTYEIQIAKDNIFSQQVLINKSIVPAVQTVPTLILPPGFLDAGHKYYWRIRAVRSIEGLATHTPWSPTMYFIVQVGFEVTTPYLGPNLLQPKSGTSCICGSPLVFNWTPFKDAKKYLFELADNPDMNSLLVSQEVPGTAIKYEGEFKCGVNYFWRVKVTEPFPSDWSATFSFFTQPKSAPIVIPGVTTTVISPTNQPVQTVIVIPPPGIPDLSIYLMIGIFVLLVICIFFFTLASRKGPLNRILKEQQYQFSRFDGIKNLLSKVKDIFRFERQKPEKATKYGSPESGLLYKIRLFMGNFKDNTIMAWRRWRYLSKPKEKPPDKHFRWK